MASIILDITIKDGTVEEDEISFTYLVSSAEEVSVIRKSLQKLDKYNNACSFVVDVRNQHG